MNDEALKRASASSVQDKLIVKMENQGKSHWKIVAYACSLLFLVNFLLAVVEWLDLLFGSSLLGDLRAFTGLDLSINYLLYWALPLLTLLLLKVFTTRSKTVWVAFSLAFVVHTALILTLYKN